MTLSPQHRQSLLDVARDVIRLTLRGRQSGEEITNEPIDDPVLAQPAGCFVTLHRSRTHELRGCVGRIEAVDALLNSVRRAAAGVLRDPRFHDEPVSYQELPELDIDLSILSPLHPAKGPLEFDPMSEGIYLTCGQRAGCFLPQVARETGWSKQQLLSRLCVEKMGLPHSAWQDAQARLFVFTTEIVGPEPFEPRAV